MTFIFPHMFVTFFWFVVILITLSKSETSRKEGNKKEARKHFMRVFLFVGLWVVTIFLLNTADSAFKEVLYKFN